MIKVYVNNEHATRSSFEEVRKNLEEYTKRVKEPNG